MLPNVVYVGMGKAGSTLLHKLFLRHNDIYVSEINKEIDFFTSPDNWNKGKAWYESQFSGYQGEKWVVDISPGYHNKLESIQRMKDTLGDDLKILFTFRRFTDFAYSRYLHTIRSRVVRGGFLEMLEKRSMFYKPLDVIIDEYIKAFGKENVLIMHYEKEFDRVTPMFEQAIYNFLGLPPEKQYYDTLKDRSVNSGCIPRFVYTKNKPYEESRDGIEYRVPPNTLVFCSGRAYKNITWKQNVIEKAAEFIGIEKSWTTCLDEKTYEYVQREYTEPLAKKLEDKLGISFEHWFVNDPRRLEYPDAPLPDAYINDPGLREQRLVANKTKTPWS